jgi:hypothetical protein
MYEESNEVEKELYHEVRDYPFNFLINDNVDYEVLMHIRIFTDGTRICEIEGETVNIFDDEGNIVDSIECYLPEKYKKEALIMAEEYDY